MCRSSIRAVEPLRPACSRRNSRAAAAPVGDRAIVATRGRERRADRSRRRSRRDRAGERGRQRPEFLTSENSVAHAPGSPSAPADMPRHRASSRPRPACGWMPFCGRGSGTLPGTHPPPDAGRRQSGDRDPIPSAHSDQPGECGRVAVECEPIQQSGIAAALAAERFPQPPDRLAETVAVHRGSPVCKVVPAAANGCADFSCNEPRTK